MGDDVRVISVEVDDRADGPRGPVSEEARAVLRRIVAEAVIRQDEAEAVLEEIRLRRPLGEVAPRGGALVSRFASLRAALPESADPVVRRHVAVLRVVLDHHACMLAFSMDLLAADWRSERIVEQLEKLTGLGPPARRLEAVRADLTRAQAPA